VTPPITLSPTGMPIRSSGPDLHPQTFAEPSAVHATHGAEAHRRYGMHYRNSTNDGARLGRRTTKWIGEPFFGPVHEKSDH